MTACNKLPNKALIERARRLIWWRSKNLPACPSAKLIREIIIRIAGMPEILDDAHVARRILEIGGVTLQPMAQPIPPVSEPQQLIPLDSHVDEEVTEEILPVGIVTNLTDLIRAEGTTQWPIGHGLGVQEEQPQALEKSVSKPTVPDRDPSTDPSASDDESSGSSSESSSSSSSSPRRKSKRSRKSRSSAIQQQIHLDAVLARHMQILQDRFADRFDCLEQDVRTVTTR